MRVAIIFKTVVGILAVRFLRCQLFQPVLKVGMQSALVVIDEDRSRNMHGIAEHQAFTDAGFKEAFFNLRSNVDIDSSGLSFEPQFFPVTFHCTLN